MEENRALKRLRETFGDRMTVEREGAEPIVRVERRMARDILAFLRDDGDCGFDMITDLFSVDCLSRKPRFDVIYYLNALSKKQRLVVKVAADDEVQSVGDLWKAAEWLEREVFDLMGIRFSGHPDLRRLLLEDDFKGHPLRKDFPLEGYDIDKPFVVNLGEEKD